MLTSEVAVVKSHHGISVKCSQHRDTGPTDPSLVITEMNPPLYTFISLISFPIYKEGLLHNTKENWETRDRIVFVR